MDGYYVVNLEIKEDALFLSLRSMKVGGFM